MSSEWVQEEMQTLQLKDTRLTRRAKQMMASFSEQPARSIPEACEHWSGSKGAYRFLSNPRVEPAQILQAHYRATLERVKGHARVLAIQDTTDLKYTGKTVAEALGYLANVYTWGLFLHSVLLVGEMGVPLGLLDQHSWSRDIEQLGQKKARRTKATVEKESQRWLDAVQVVEERLPEEVEVVHIGDREADMYDLFTLPRRPGSQVLIRVDQNRRVEHELDYLWAAMQQAPIAGERTVEVTPQANREPRLATLRIRFLTLTIRPTYGKAGPGVPLQFVLAEEYDAPPGEEPIVWLLATSLPVNSLAEALLCLDYYCLRWLIERFHFVLKSGCLVEQLYLQTPDRLLRALVIYAIVAWRLLWLTYEARQNPEQSCVPLLATHEWQALYCTIHHTPVPPDTPPTFLQAIIWIARLGGFLARTHDGFPGPKTIWRGLRRLDDIADTWLLLHPPPPT